MKEERKNENENRNQNYMMPFYNDGTTQPNINNGPVQGEPQLNYEDLILQNLINNECIEPQNFEINESLFCSVDNGINNFYPVQAVQPSEETFMNNNRVLGEAYMNNSNAQSHFYSMQPQLKQEGGSSTGSPLSYSEDKVNLAEINDRCDRNCEDIAAIPSSPLLVLSIMPWIGPYNFRVNIPEPSLLGAKPKWCFSKELNRLYVAKNVAFPVNITSNAYPPGALLNVCPVYNKSSNRMTPVHRCPNCRFSDPNTEVCYHVIQIEGSSPVYFEKGERFMFSVPLGTPAPGDSMINLFLKVCCNTSCIGGPNRRTFCILISLELNEMEVGRQVIDVKCCEGPTRDMNRDEKNQGKESILQPSNQNQNQNLEMVREVATQVAKSKYTKKTSVKLKDEQPTEQQLKKENMDMELVMIPKIYVKRVKKYVNLLHMKDQVKKISRREYSNLKILPVSTSESEN